VNPSVESIPNIYVGGLSNKEPQFEAALESDHDWLAGEPRTRGLVAEDFAAAAVLVQPFMLYLVALRVQSPPPAGAWSSADPILRLLPPDPMLLLAPLFGVALTIAWLTFSWPSWGVFKRELLGGLAGSLLVCGAAFAWWKLRGDHLPPAFRLEESSGGHPCLHLMAGYVEETLVRLIVLPILFLNLVGRSRGAAILLASLAAGVAFAALHEPGARDFVPMLFVIRLVVPGVALSLLALLTRPSLAISAHLTAHVVVPLLFV
jgi:hypothetical protein